MTHQQSFDETMMRRALELAARGCGLVSPSPLVGCVITNSENRIVGQGAYIYEDITHAEVLALTEAGEKARGGTAYVSLEPHAHHGRTPPCTDALLRAGIARVVAPIEDPNPLVSGKGFAILKSNKVDVVTGVLVKQAATLNEKYICAMQARRPFVHLKMAGSLDGRIDFGAQGNSVTYLSNKLSLQRVHQLRHEYDAILVGANTVRRDNPSLTDRSRQPRRRPLVRVVFDERLALPHDSNIFTTANTDAPTLVFADESRADSENLKQLARHNVEVELLPSGTRDLKAVLDNLYRRQLHSVLLEGGATLAASFINARLVDKITFIIAPLIIANANATHALRELTAPVRLSDITHTAHGDDLEITGYPSQGNI